MLILKNTASKTSRIFEPGSERQHRTLERESKSDRVLVFVNDAESMKRLRQRFRAVGDEE
jgi:hypothetical protein